MDFGNKTRIKDFLNKYFSNNPKVSTTDFCNKMGLTSAALSRWRNPDDTNGPTVDVLPKICEVLDISLYALYQISDPTNLTSEELLIINEYRKQTNMQQAVKNVLSIK